MIADQMVYAAAGSVLVLTSVSLLSPVGVSAARSVSSTSPMGASILVMSSTIAAMAAPTKTAVWITSVQITLAMPPTKV